MALVVKIPPATAGDVRDTGSIPGSGKSPGEGISNPLQFSCLENPINRGAWQATVHRVTQSWTQLQGLSTHTVKGFSIVHETEVDVFSLESPCFLYDAANVGN